MKQLLFASLLLLSLSATAQRKTCAGTTKAGKPCKSVIINKEGYCRHHDPKTVKCAGKTSKGKPCGVVVKKPGEYCRYHKVN